jgi:hypothetical protein
LLSSLFLTAKLLATTQKKTPTPKIVILLRDVPSPPLPFAPSAANVVTGSLDDTFDAMLLDQHDVSPGNFSDKWVAANAKEALALSSADDARLKECTVAASASVWGLRRMRSIQLEACYCLLHPHRPNALVVGG